MIILDYSCIRTIFTLIHSCIIGCTTTKEYVHVALHVPIGLAFPKNFASRPLALIVVHTSTLVMALCLLVHGLTSVPYISFLPCMLVSVSIIPLSGEGRLMVIRQMLHVPLVYLTIRSTCEVWIEGSACKLL